MLKHFAKILKVALLLCLALEGACQTPASHDNSNMGEEEHLKDVQAFWAKQVSDFKGTTETPLSAKQKKDFDTLDVYPVNHDLRVVAKFTLLEKQKTFKMKTTTDRLPEYRKFGVAEFNIDGKTYQLAIYQSIDLAKIEKYKNHIFVPFRDASNGEETYGGGRYIDLEIPQGDSIVIDFNKAYNPYCAYAHRFSCPIPPAENTLPIAILAGEKNFGNPE